MFDTINNAILLECLLNHGVSVGYCSTMVFDSDIKFDKKKNLLLSVQPFINLSVFTFKKLEIISRAFISSCLDYRNSLYLAVGQSGVLLAPSTGTKLCYSPPPKASS